MPVLEVLANVILQEKKKKKDIHIGKEEIKQTQLEDDMILHVKSHQDYTPPKS